MFHEKAVHQTSSFRKIGFADKVWRCLEKSDQNGLKLRIGTFSETMEILDKARRQVTIASNEVIGPILEKNPAIIQLSDTKKDKTDRGLLAMLPLNDLGLSALVDGSFGGIKPNVGWICAPGEPASALYIWLVFMPGTFGRMLAGIANAIDTLAPHACPMFSKSTSHHSTRLHKGAGFKSAQEFYPDCADDLLVVFPEASLAAAGKRQTEVRPARTIDDIFKVFSVRSATYLAEQLCLHEEEFDGNDFCSTHFLGLIDGDAAGCVRLRFFEGFAKLERLAVRTEYRQSRLAFQLVRAALEHCKRKGYSRVLGHSRLDLVRFWRTFGFRPIEDRPEFSFANIRYAEILLEQDVAANAIHIGADPMIILRPEGAWEQPGPFDLPTRTGDPRLSRMIEGRTKTLGQRSITV